MEKLKSFLEERNGDESEEERKYGNPTEKGSEHRGKVISDDRNRQ